MTRELAVPAVVVAPEPLQPSAEPLDREEFVTRFSGRRHERHDLGAAVAYDMHRRRWSEADPLRALAAGTAIEALSTWESEGRAGTGGQDTA